MTPLRIQRLELRSIRIPFREAFRHASADRAETSSVWVEAHADGIVGFGESCPRPYVTGEDEGTACAFFERHQSAVRDAVQDVDSLRAWVSASRDVIDANPAAWCAIELAVLDLIGKRADEPVEATLGLPALTGRFQYSAVIGDAADAAFRLAGDRYRRHGFRDFKIKLSGDAARDHEKCAWLRDLDPDVRVRADANNLWPDGDAALAYLDELHYPFHALEEPVRSGAYADMARIAAARRCPIILDESCLRLQQLADLAAGPDQWIINLRVSKMGGLLRSLAVLDAARRVNIRLVVGAQVGETSLLTRAGLTVAGAGRDLLVAQEGAFGTQLLTRDVCHPPLMFGEAGWLDVQDHALLTAPGLGVTQQPGVDP